MGATLTFDPVGDFLKGLQALLHAFRRHRRGRR
jgi:hypothetical protein